MIECLVMCESKHWPARFKKVNSIVKKILTFKKDLGFKVNVNYNCNIILSDNKLIKKMNHKFRNQKIATDILTFVSEVDVQKKHKIKVCDIMLSAEFIKKDAKFNKITFYDHLTHLIIHGFLHVNGFTHKKIKNFKQMRNIEIEILRKLKINDPYLYH